MTTIGQQLVTRRRFAASTIVDGRERLGAPTDVVVWATIDPVSRRRLEQDPLLDDVKEALAVTCEQLDWRAGDPELGLPPDRLYRGLLTPTRVVVTFTKDEADEIPAGTVVATVGGVQFATEEDVELEEVDLDVWAGTVWARALVNGAVTIVAEAVTVVGLAGVEVSNALAGEPGTEPSCYEVHQATFVGGTPDDEQRAWSLLVVRRDLP